MLAAWYCIQAKPIPARYAMAVASRAETARRGAAAKEARDELAFVVRRQVFREVRRGSDTESCTRAAEARIPAGECRAFTLRSILRGEAARRSRSRAAIRRRRRPLEHVHRGFEAIRIGEAQDRRRRRAYDRDVGSSAARASRSARASSGSPLARGDWRRSWAERLSYVATQATCRNLGHGGTGTSTPPRR